MIRAPKLAASRPMYAFDPATWMDEPYGDRYVTHRVDACWFRRKSGVLVASMGTYRPYVLNRADAPEPYAGYEAWIAAADDNRYGGKHIASWDGAALLCTDQPITPQQSAARIAALDAMLRGFPDPPAGFDGWWTFPRAVNR